MKNKNFLLKLFHLVLYLIPFILGILLTVQLSTTRVDLLSHWQTALFILIMYMLVLCGFVLAAFLAQLTQQFFANQLFTTRNLITAHRIRHCLLVIALLTLGIIPKFYQMADLSDAPGALLIGLTIVSIPFLVYFLTSMLIRLFEQAIGLKNDADLTV